MVKPFLSLSVGGRHALGRNPALCYNGETMSNGRDLSRPFVEVGETMPCHYWVSYQRCCMYDDTECPCSLGGEGIYRAESEHKINYGYSLREIE